VGLEWVVVCFGEYGKWWLVGNELVDDGVVAELVLVGD